MVLYPSPGVPYFILGKEPPLTVLGKGSLSLLNAVWGVY